MSRSLSNVNPPELAVMPMVKLVAVMLAKSLFKTVKVPPAPPTVIDLLPLGRRSTSVAMMLPAKEISFAITVKTGIVSVVEAAIVKSPEPFGITDMLLVLMD